MKKRLFQKIILIMIVLLTACSEKDSDKGIDCQYNGKLIQGAEYVNGQYTYRYMQDYNKEWLDIEESGWGVALNDKTAQHITTKLCNTINGKPIISMSHMFDGSKAESIDLSSFNTSNVTDMSYMFDDVKLKKLDISNFNISKVKDIRNMFGDQIETIYVDSKDDINFYKKYTSSAWAKNFVAKNNIGNDESSDFIIPTKDDGIKKQANELYNSFIAIQNSPHYIYIDADNSFSDSYLIHYAISKIIDDNNININNYDQPNDVFCDIADDECLVKDGYKISSKEVEEYIKKYFNISRKIEHKCDFNEHIDIYCYYVQSESVYKVLGDMPFMHLDSKLYYKLESYVQQNNDIILYTSFYAIRSDDYGGASFYNNINQINELDEIFRLNYNMPDYHPSPEDYFMDNLQDKKGIFKHIFRKNADGNYYWVSSEQISF